MSEMEFTAEQKLRDYPKNATLIINRIAQIRELYMISTET